MLTPFALDETLIRHLTKGKKTARSFTSGSLEDNVILNDPIKVPYLEEGLERLHAHGFTLRCTPLGGLVVVSNEGILNITCFLK